MRDILGRVGAGGDLYSVSVLRPAVSPIEAR